MYANEKMVLIMEDERVVTNKELKEDTYEASIRPDSIDEYIGQADVKEEVTLKLLVDHL